MTPVWPAYAVRLIVVSLGLLATACSSRAPAPRAASGPPAAVPDPALVPFRIVDGIAIVRPGRHREVSGQRRRGLALRPRAPALPAEDVGYYLDVQQARLQQLGDVASLERRGETLVVTLSGGSHFESGSSRLSEGARDALTRLARALTEYDATLITLHGHTDATGTVEANARLSEDRALSVARVLRAEGVAAQRLMVVGHGQLEPVASNEDEAGRARNRRVELHLEPLVQPPVRVSDSSLAAVP